MSPIRVLWRDEQGDPREAFVDPAAIEAITDDPQGCQVFLACSRTLILSEPAVVVAKRWREALWPTRHGAERWPAGGPVLPGAAELPSADAVVARRAGGPITIGPVPTPPLPPRKPGRDRDEGPLSDQEMEGGSW